MLNIAYYAQNYARPIGAALPDPPFLFGGGSGNKTDTVLALIHNLSCALLQNISLPHM